MTCPVSVELTSTKMPIIEEPFDSAFKTILFLPEGEERKGNSGGVHTQGYFKKSLYERPLITVITVVFNGVQHLEQTILSVIGQSYDNIEYIIIDGGSTDGTMEVIEKYEYAIDYWVSEKDKGIYDAMNKGIELASGDWICFLGADDFFWNLRVIDQAVDYLNNIAANVFIAYGNVMFLNENGKLLYIVGDFWEKKIEKFKNFMCICHQGIFHRRNAFELYGKYDISFKIAGDYEFLMRIFKETAPCYLSNCIIAGMRKGGISSNHSNSILLLKEIRYAQWRHGKKRPGIIWFIQLIKVYVRLFLLTLIGADSTEMIINCVRKYFF